MVRIFCQISLFLFLFVFCIANAYSQGNQPPKEIELSPLSAPRKSSILLSVDYTKTIRNFEGGSIAIFATDLDKSARSQGMWEQTKDCRYNTVEIRINKDFRNIFPKADADPAIPESYDFTILDENIRKASENCFEIILVFETPEFPADIGRYSTQIDSVLRHIFKGWANGFRMKENEVKFIIFDCMPDVDNGFWYGKENEYIRLYALFAKNVKKISNKLAVGGFGYVNVFKDEKDYLYKEISPLIASNLEFLAKNKIPLDCIYWRNRAMIPYSYFLKAKTIEQQILKDYKTLSPVYGKPKIVCYADIIPRDAAGVLESTVYVNAIMCCIKGGADFISIPAGIHEKNTLFTVLKEINIFSEYPVQLETLGLDRLCFILMAAKSRDGKKMVFIVSGNNPSSYLIQLKDSKVKKEIEQEYRSIVDNFSEKVFPPVYERYHINIAGLPWKNSRIMKKKIVIDEGKGIEYAEEKELNNTKELYFNERIGSPSIQLIFIEAQPIKDEDRK